MKAIIMAAGKGSRLGNLTDNKPKAFLEIEGIKLIEYNIGLLHEYGIRDIIIVTGYYNEKYEEVTSGIDGVTCVFNPFYEMMNVLGSFFIGQEYLTEGEDVVYMHADTLCDPGIFEKMLKEDGDMVLPVDFKPCDEEAMKVRLSGEGIAEISKEIPCEIAEGEFIGIAKVSGGIVADIKAAAKTLMKKKEFTAYFERAIQHLIDQKKFNIKAISTEGRFWGEIDFPEDYERAAREISPELVEIGKKEQNAWQ